MAPKKQKIISTREQRQKFDNAVKDVIRQRKEAIQLQNAVRQSMRGGNVDRDRLRALIQESNMDIGGGGSRARSMQASATPHNNHPRHDSSGTLRTAHGSMPNLSRLRRHNTNTSHGSSGNSNAGWNIPSGRSASALKESNIDPTNRRSSDGDTPFRRGSSKGSLGSSEDYRLSYSPPPSPGVGQRLNNNRNKAAGPSRQLQQHCPQSARPPRRVTSEGTSLASLGDGGRGIKIALASLNSGKDNNGGGTNDNNNGTTESSFGYRPTSNNKDATAGDERGGMFLRSNSNSVSGGEISNSLKDIRLEDLVPTRRRTIEREDSGKSINKSASSFSVALSPIASCDGMSPTASADGDGDVIQRAYKEGDKREGQWKKGQFGLQPSAVQRDISTGSGDESGGRSGVPSCASSYKTAEQDPPSRETSPSPTGEQVHGGESNKGEGVDNPRSQFLLLKKERKSQSGATRETQATSSSSSLTCNENPVSSGNNVNNRIGAIKEVKEEEKDISASDGARELASGDSFEIDCSGGAPAGFSKYRKRRSSRIKRIRTNLKNSLRSTGSNEESEMRPSLEENSKASQGSISEEQQQRVSRFLQRKTSTRSVTSAISSFTAITRSSDTSTSTSGRWSRIKRGMGMKKAQSTSNVGGRQISIRSTSNISNVSSRSNTSADGNDSVFLDFYDHNDHARAVSSLMSKSTTSVLSAQLSIVEEPTNGEGGEQKHDEDYHNEREHEAHRAMMNDSVLSDDSMISFYRYPSHDHPLVHMRPNQLFPDSPGWQCDECSKETFDLNVWAYVSTERNFLLCECCFSKTGFSVSAG